MRERLRVLGARDGPTRPERRDELIEVAAAALRRPLDEREAVGREHHDLRPRRADLDAGAVEYVDPLGASAVHRETEAVVGTDLVGEAQFSAAGILAVAHELAVSPGPPAAPGRREHDGLEQVGLPGAVGSVDDREVGVEWNLNLGVGPQLRGAKRAESHQAARAPAF